MLSACHERIFQHCSSHPCSTKVIDVNNTESLQGLIDQAVAKRKTSVRQLGFLAQDAGFKVVGTTLSHIRAGRYKSVPSEDTIRAIAYLAGVDESVAFAAAGQQVPGPPLADELPPGADLLSPKSRKAVVDMVRVLVDLEAGNNAERTEAEQDTPRQLKPVAPTSDTSPRQKTTPDGGVIELHGDEARSIPVPPREKLAAHPKVKTRRDELNDQSGVQEENQDFNDF